VFRFESCGLPNLFWRTSAVCEASGAEGVSWRFHEVLLCASTSCNPSCGALASLRELCTLCSTSSRILRTLAGLIGISMVQDLKGSSCSHACVSGTMLARTRFGTQVLVTFADLI
jgi:hypothetical protein